MAQTLDLAVLDSGDTARAIVMARSGCDVALARLDCGATLEGLVESRRVIDDALLGRARRPTRHQLTEFGNSLFNFIISGDVARLYGRLPHSFVRVHVLSDRADLRSLPWEYLQDPERPPGPSVGRSVVRVVPTVGVPAPTPVRLSGSRGVKVLFASADPYDQELVSWVDVKASVERTFAVRIPGRFTLTAIEATTRTSLVDEVQKSNCDIFHFSGHGKVIDGVGNLVLMGRGNRSSYLRADDLASMLQGRGISLVVLSACDTATGDFDNNFAVTAEALVRAGIPAVVANQLPVPDSSVALFVGRMYDELLRSGDIDRAVDEGRIKLATELEAGSEAVLEWGIPTLYRHIAGEKVFDL